MSITSKLGTFIVGDPIYMLSGRDIAKFRKEANFERNIYRTEHGTLFRAYPVSDGDYAVRKQTPHIDGKGRVSKKTITIGTVSVGSSWLAICPEEAVPSQDLDDCVQFYAETAEGFNYKRTCEDWVSTLMTTVAMTLDGGESRIILEEINVGEWI
jgi:hypothetical protein